jgi:23S rRNA pseudouridine955/2504/2580 synthase
MANPSGCVPSQVRYVKVDERHAGQRLDNFLLRVLKGVPKSRVYRLLRRGEIRVNRGRSRPDYRLEVGDVVRLPPVRQPAEAARVTLTARGPEAYAWLEDRVLYEDEHMLILDKPAGIPVHGGSRVPIGLIEALRHARPYAARLELVHRLDRQTSGCLLIAKSRPALTALHRAWQAGEVEKRYLALVKGDWRRRREIAAPLVAARLAGSEDSEGGRRRIRVSEAGRPALSRFEPRRRYGPATLVEITLLTGRMHQARVHAAHAGHPIAGDEQYGDRAFNRELRATSGLKRLFLHAARLEFRHPVSGSRMRIESPLPAELKAVLERLS